MNILISSGIYPPDIGGPAQYARNLYETWKSQGHNVKVAAYRWERAFPPVVRHILFFLKIIRKGYKADMILVLDTWSAAVPTMCACMLMRKKYILRTGGDALWESYVERTGDLVLFKDFYPAALKKLSLKEKMMFNWGGASLRHASAVIFSTNWQKSIFEKAYSLDSTKNRVVENYYGPRMEPTQPEERVFVAAGRTLKLKNIDILRSAFTKAKIELQRRGLPDVSLDMGRAIHDGFLDKMHRAYAVILVSISEMSPNMIAEAIQVGTPFIMTKENGITDRVGKTAVLVDPTNEADIVSKIVWLSDPKNRASQAAAIRGFNFTHSWSDIAKEIEAVNGTARK